MALFEGQKKRKYIYPPPPVVSINCSSFRSFYRTCRRYLGHSKSSPTTLSQTISRSQHKPITTPANSHSLKNFADGRVTAEAYWQRACQLELQLIQLNQWISVEKNLRDRVNKYNHCKLEEEESKIEIIGLVNGGFIYENKITGEIAGRLVIQISAPAIVPAEIGSDISQVLHILASMGAERLRTWLVESLPLDNIQHNQMQVSRGDDVNKPTGGFVEDIVSASMEEMEILVLEGLKFQMGQKEKGQHAVFVENENRGDEDRIVVAMLIQARDPANNYEAVQDFMIGLVEASVAEEEENGFRIKSIHVAGISTRLGVNKRISSVKNSSHDSSIPSASDYLWSMSAKECEESCSVVIVGDTQRTRT